MIQGFSPDKLEEFSKKIADSLPEIKEVLKQLKSDEIAYREENKIPETDHIFYTLMLTGSKAVVHIFAGKVTEKTIEIEGVKIGKGAILLYKSLKRIEIMELLERAAKDGLLKVAAEFTTARLVKQLTSGK